jgi:hypothetical protein
MTRSASRHELGNASKFTRGYVVTLYTEADPATTRFAATTNGDIGLQPGREGATMSLPGQKLTCGTSTGDLPARACEVAR